MSDYSFDTFFQATAKGREERFKKEFEKILAQEDISRRTRIYQLITNERHRQELLHPTSMGSKSLAVLGEEFGEVCRDVFEENEENLIKELIETAAVCVRWLEELEV